MRLDQLIKNRDMAISLGCPLVAAACLRILNRKQKENTMNILDPKYLADPKFLVHMLQKVAEEDGSIYGTIVAGYRIFEDAGACPTGTADAFEKAVESVMRATGNLHGEKEDRQGRGRRKVCRVSR